MIKYDYKKIDKSEVVEGIEMKINFRLQIIVTFILVIAGFICSLWFNKVQFTRDYTE